jgi:carboxymethylenebutenolidase
MQEEFGIPRTKEEKIEGLIHLYVDGGMNRRDLIRRLARLTGGAASAAAVLETAGLAQTPAPAPADDVRVGENDPAIEWKDVSFPGKAGSVLGLLAAPRPCSGPRRERLAPNWNGPQPAVLLLHENRGLVEHIRDITRRVAKAGFVALGLDLLSRQRGTGAFADDNAKAQAYGRTVQTERHEDMQSAVEYLRKSPNVVGNRVGAVGFCAGGGNILYSVYNGLALEAAVSFYGTPPNPLPATGVTTPLLCIYSENDRAQAGRIPALSESLVDARVTFGIQVYKGTNHAFFNDTGAVYNRDAALDAWERTIAFLNTHLRA